MAVKLGICEWCFPAADPSNCKTVAECGFDGLSLTVGSYETGFHLIDPAVQARYLEEKDRWGIAFPSIAANDTWRFSMLADPNSEEGMTVHKLCYGTIDAASAMKIPCMFAPSVGKSDINSPETLKATAVFLRDLCEYAADKGVTVCTENLLDIAHNLQLVELVARANFGIYFDTQNPHGFHGYDPAEMIRSLGSHIIETHVKDGFSGQIGAALLGTGTSEFQSSIRAFLDIGYSGWFISENMYFYEPLCPAGANPYELIRKDVETLKSCFTDI